MGKLESLLLLGGTVAHDPSALLAEVRLQMPDARGARSRGSWQGVQVDCTFDPYQSCSGRPTEAAPKKPALCRRLNGMSCLDYTSRTSSCVCSATVPLANCAVSTLTTLPEIVCGDGSLTGPGVR